MNQQLWVSYQPQQLITLGVSRYNDQKRAHSIDSRDLPNVQVHSPES